MRVNYTGQTSPNLHGRMFKLSGDDAWNEKRFEVLQKMNPKGKVAIIEVKEGQERDKYLVQIGELVPADEPRNF